MLSGGSGDRRSGYLEDWGIWISEDGGLEIGGSGVGRSGIGDKWIGGTGWSDCDDNGVIVTVIELFHDDLLMPYTAIV